MRNPKSFKIPIPRVFSSPEFVGDTFPYQFGILKVEKKCDFEACDVQVAEHLSDVAVVKSRDDFRIGDDLAIHN